MLADIIHQLLPLLDPPPANGVQAGDLVLAQTTTPAPPPAPPPAGAPDFSNIAPDSRGVPKAGAMYTIAQVVLFFGLGILFLVLLFGIIAWAAGHIANGMHVSQSAKGHILRAVVSGIVLTAAGGIWTWVTAI